MPIAYATLPVPAFDAFTRRIPAGAVTFGVEYRRLDEAAILAHYGPDARAKFGHVLPAGFAAGAVDEDGLCLHVFASADGAEILRFDCFEDAAHYHLLDPRIPRNIVVEHDTAQAGPLLDWALAALRGRAAELLRQAGAADLAGEIEPDRIARALVEVERACREALAVGAPIRAALPHATTTASPH
jgi:hypothetical protein